MVHLRNVRIVTVLLVLLAGIVGFAVAQGTGATKSGGDCTEWVFYPDVAGSAGYDGFLLCRNSGELWLIDRTKKKLVREAG